MPDASCHAIVTRAFVQESCDKPAAGYAKPSGDEVDPWPACAYHLNRWGAMPLVWALAEVWGAGYEAAASDFHDMEFGLPGAPTPNPYRTEETDHA